MTQPPSPPEPGRRISYGPQTWALIREAYLAGTPAPHLSRTFGPNEHTIRKRAVREGWTRLAHALAQEPTWLAAAAPTHAVAALPEAGAPPAAPPSPREAVNAALTRASAQLATGFANDAASTLKAAEFLHRLSEDVAAAHARADAREAARETDFAAWIELRAAALATAVLTGETDTIRPANAAWAARWWDEHEGELEELD